MRTNEKRVMEKQKENIALITGASRGLGEAISEILASKGFHTILVAKTVGALESLYDKIINKGGTASVLPLDITNEEAIKKSCIMIYERWGRLDLWAHTAINAPALSPVEHIDSTEFKKTLEVNVISTSRLINNLSPLLKKSKKSKAIFFDDPISRKKYHTSYGISKISQMHLVHKWKEENSKKNPSIFIETPSPMETSTRQKFYPGEDKVKLTKPIKQAKEIVSRILNY